MEITGLQEDLRSVQQALSMTVLRNAMNQNPEAVGKLIEGMQEVSAKVMEDSVYPHLGGNIDTSV